VEHALQVHEIGVIDRLLFVGQKFQELALSSRRLFGYEAESNYVMQERCNLLTIKMRTGQVMSRIIASSRKHADIDLPIHPLRIWLAIATRYGGRTFHGLDHCSSYALQVESHMDALQLPLEAQL
jgi:hypothetical protein